MFTKIIIVNRGEIAIRIIRACKESGCHCEDNIPTTMEVHTREGHPFRWLHGPHKDPYLVTEYGEKLGLGSRKYELIDVMPLEFPERSSLIYVAAN